MKLMKIKLSKICPCCRKRFFKPKNQLSNKQWLARIWCSGRCREQKIPINQYKIKRLNDLLMRTITTSTGCMEWQGGFRGKYPMIRLLGLQESGGRIIWKLVNGTIPNEMCVCHHCDNPKCLNIDHLFLGTKGENNADRHAKNRTFRKIQPNEKIEIIKMAIEGIPYRIIAKKFSVSAMVPCYIAKQNGIHRR